MASDNVQSCCPLQVRSEMTASYPARPIQASHWFPSLLGNSFPSSFLQSTHLSSLIKIIGPPDDATVYALTTLLLSLLLSFQPSVSASVARLLPVPVVISKTTKVASEEKPLTPSSCERSVVWLGHSG